MSHIRADGHRDMRFKENREAARHQSNARSAMFSQHSEAMKKGAETSKRIDRGSYMEKRGSKNDGTDAAHIFSYEVLNTVLSNTPGRGYGEEETRNIQRAMNSSDNLRIKSRQGNLTGTDGYSGDMSCDTYIMNALNGNDKRLTNQRAVNRLEMSWESVQRSDLPEGLKANIRDQFSQIKDQDGRSIVRANASLYA